MNIEMSQEDVKKIARQVEEQITKNAASESFRELVDKRVEQKANAYMAMNMTDECIGDIFYKEIKRFFENKKSHVVAEIAKVLKEELADEVTKEFLVRRITEALDDI